MSVGSVVGLGLTDGEGQGVSEGDGLGEGVGGEVGVGGAVGDSVGGTVLLVRADLHREGLVFPAFPYRGFIETEGLAAMAKDLGVRCWGLPDLEVWHP